MASDGSGVSLAKRHEDLAAREPGNWTWSEQVLGTPGGENFPNQSGPDRSIVFNEVQPGDAGTFWCEIVINEILYHPSPNRPDPNEPAPTWVELYNRSDHAVDLTGWQLTDGIAFAFEPNTILAPDAYLVVASDTDTLRASVSRYPHRGRLRRTSVAQGRQAPAARWARTARG